MNRSRNLLIIGSLLVGGMIGYNYLNSTGSHGPAVFVPSQDTIQKEASIIEMLRAQGFIMRTGNDTAYVNRDWYDLPLDRKQNFVLIFHVACAGRTVLIFDGFSGKLLASASSGRADIKSE